VIVNPGVKLERPEIRKTKRKKKLLRQYQIQQMQQFLNASGPGAAYDG
jgi:hypothetical protein